MTRTSEIYSKYRSRKRERLKYTGNFTAMPNAFHGETPSGWASRFSKRQKRESQKINLLDILLLAAFVALIFLSILASGIGSNGPILAVILAGIPIIIFTSILAFQIFGK